MIDLIDPFYIEHSREAYLILGGAGLFVYLTKYINWKQLIKKSRQDGFWTWRNFSKNARERIAWELDGVVGRSCQNALSWVVPFIRPVRQAHQRP